MKVSHDLVTDPGGNARSTVQAQRDAAAPTATKALETALTSSAAGEIRNDHLLEPGSASKHATLLGVAPTTRHGIDRSRLFVAPATVTALSKFAKTRYPTQPTVKVELSSKPASKRFDTDIIPLTKRKEGGANENKWQAFEDLGLAPKPTTKSLQKLVVSGYRLLGFGILSLIVFVLVGYIATNAFYFLNKSWVTPVVLSSNDDKVV
ncbi:MAG: hypothetical protein H0U13_01965, partial [Gemmatimonadaceae bacterium]|nr:hypothetical protein [Gemmatimonadaceae bacterium]